MQWPLPLANDQAELAEFNVVRNASRELLAFHN